MPGRPPKPTALHIVQGTDRKCRMEKRAGEVDPEPGLPDAPDWMLPEALVEWGRLTSDSKYIKALRKVDRAMIAVFCQMWGRYVEGEKNGSPVSTSHVAALINLGAKLGLNPADRVKVKVPESEKPKSAWQKLKAGS